MAAIAEGFLLLDPRRWHGGPGVLACERMIQISHVVGAIIPCCLGRLDGVSNKRLGLEFESSRARMHVWRRRVWRAIAWRCVILAGCNLPEFGGLQSISSNSNSMVDQ